MTRKYRRHADYPQPSGNNKFTPYWESISLQKERLKPSKQANDAKEAGEVVPFFLHCYCMESLRKLKLWCDPAMPSLKPANNRDTRISMFIAALFQAAMPCSQSRCTATDESIRNMWYPSTQQTHSAVEELLPFARKQVELESMLSEISEAQKVK